MLFHLQLRFILCVAFHTVKIVLPLLALRRSSHGEDSILAFAYLVYLWQLDNAGARALVHLVSILVRLSLSVFALTHLW